MRKKIKSIIAIGMVSLMVFGCTNAKTSDSGTSKTDNAGQDTTQAEAPSEYPDYLNLESARPIIKDGEEITLKLMVMRESIANSDINENWFAKFIEEKLNINLEIEEVNEATFEERRNLRLASNDLPDIMINLGLGGNDIVTYGVDGKQFLPLSDYIDEKLTPNIVKVLEGQDAAIAENTAPDGKMYTLPSFSANYPGAGNTIGVQKLFLDTKYMEAAGITEIPETLDGFIEMLRAFKQLDPASMGVKEIWPMVSTWGNDLELLENAFGWITSNRKDFLAAVWDVETNSVEIPASQEKFGEFIKVLNTLYTEGLIHPDFFTIDKTMARALYAEGAVPVIADAAPYVSVPNRFDDYVSLIPLSSDYIDNGVTLRSLSYTMGRFNISADTEYPEVCLRLLDYLYSPEGSVYGQMGAPAGSEDTMGLIGGFYLGDNNSIMFKDVDSGKYESQFDYEVNAIRIAQNTPKVEEYTILQALEMLGVEDPQYPVIDFTKPDDHYKGLCYEAHAGHMVDGLPGLYMNAEQAVRSSDLGSVLKNYVNAEVAKFVVGQRPLSELDQYFEEIKALGMDELVELNKSLYKNYKGPQN